MGTARQDGMAANVTEGHSGGRACQITEKYSPCRARNKLCVRDSGRKEWFVSYLETKKAGDKGGQRTFTAGWQELALETHYNWRYPSHLSQAGKAVK